MQVTHYFCDHCGEEVTGCGKLKFFHVELNACHGQNELSNRMALEAAQQGYRVGPGPLLMPDVQFTAQLCEKHYNEAVAMLKVVQGWVLDKATPEAKD